MSDPELSIACPSCSAPAGEDCRGFGYCPVRSAAAGDSDTQPDPYIDAMAAEHVNEFDPDWTIAPAATLQEWMDDNGQDADALAAGSVAFGPRTVTKDDAAVLIQEVLDRKPLTANHATALARGTGVPVYFWLNLEHSYRAGLAAGLTDMDRQNDGDGNGPAPVLSVRTTAD